MTPQQVAEYLVWYTRKVKGPVADVARHLLEEFPWLREPLEAAALVLTPETLDVETFLAGLDSPNHSPESRRAWVALFFRDLRAAATPSQAPPANTSPSRSQTDD